MTTEHLTAIRDISEPELNERITKIYSETLYFCGGFWDSKRMGMFYSTCLMALSSLTSLACRIIKVWNKSRTFEIFSKPWKHSIIPVWSASNRFLLRQSVSSELKRDHGKNSQHCWESGAMECIKQDGHVDLSSRTFPIRKQTTLGSSLWKMISCVRGVKNRSSVILFSFCFNLPNLYWRIEQLWFSMNLGSSFELPLKTKHT